MKLKELLDQMLPGERILVRYNREDVFSGYVRGYHAGNLEYLDREVMAIFSDKYDDSETMIFILLKV